MRNLLVIAPIVGLSDEEVLQRKEMLNQHSRKGTSVEFECIEDGPESIESRYEWELAKAGVLKKIIRAENQGFDGVIIWCGDDPAVQAGREVVDIPVVGPGEASILLALALGSHFSIISPVKGLIAAIEEYVASLGFSHKLASVRSFDLPVLDLRKNVEKTVEKIVEASRKAIEQDGADVIIHVCLGTFGLAKAVEKEIGIPVIDPAIAALKQAEMLIEAGYSYSRLKYPRPQILKQ